MDAKPRKRRRESSGSLQRQRWSMSSQRLEQIVAELIKPVSHYGQSFDRDDSGLLEEYLTAAGLHALEVVEAGQEPVVPNYAEMGMVIQSFANNYSKKVDHLGRLVNSLSQTLVRNNVLQSPEEADTSGESPTVSSSRRRRDTDPAPPSVGFLSIELVACAGARREGLPTAPPPTLPRVYAELQPRPPAEERELRDYNEEIIGSLADFHVAWRLHNGYLAEELESGGVSNETLQPLSLMELQEACARGAEPAPTTPPPTPPTTPPLTTPCTPSAASTPLPAITDTPSPERMPPPAALKRKRKSEVRIDDVLAGSLVINIDASLMRHLKKHQEFSISESWIRRVIRHRKEEILKARRLQPPPFSEFRGFDMAWTDIGGFKGWPAVESTAARAAARQTAALLGDLDSDDDGFFERSSSLGDSTRFSVDHSYQVSSEGADGAELESWQAGVARRADAASPLDLRALARDVRRALPPPPRALSWDQLAAATRNTQPVARVFLDLLMKTTKGETEIIDTNPLSVGDFSIRVLTEEQPLSVEDDDWLAITGAPPPEDI